MFELETLSTDSVQQIFVVRCLMLTIVTYYAKIHLSATLFNMNWNGTASYTTIFFFAYEWIFSCIVLTPTRTDEWVNKANENWGSVEEKRDSKHGRRQKSRKRIIKKKDPEWMKQKTTQRHRITSNNYR